MAGELASAIALQGQPRNRPQSTGVSEAALDNAFNGRRRADEERKRKEDAEKDKRLDSIMKNSVFTKQYENDYFNRVSQQQMTKAMDEVLQAYESGDENVGVVGARAVNKLQQIHKTLYSADKSMSAAQKAYDKDPNGLGVYNDQQTIGGKSFSNVFQAINSGETDAFMPDVADKYWSPGTEITERDVAGEKMWIPQFVPGGAVTTDPFSLVEKDVNNPDNATWQNPVPETFKLGDTTVQSHKFQIEPTVAAKLAAQGMALPESINFIDNKDYKNRRQQAEAQGKTWTRKDQAALPEQERVAVIKSYAEWLSDKIHQRVGRRERIQNTPAAPKAAAPSDFEKTFDKDKMSAQFVSVSPDGGNEKQYNVIKYPLRAGKTKQATPVTFGKGHVVIDSEGGTESPSGTQSREVLPYGPLVLDGGVFFAYTGKRGEDASTLYLNPLDQASFVDWQLNTGAPEELVINQVKTLAKGDALVKEQVGEFLKKFEMSGLPVPAKGTGTQKDEELDEFGFPLN